MLVLSMIPDCKKDYPAENKNCVPCGVAARQ